MKRFIFLVTSTVCFLSLVTNLNAQSADEEVWSINTVKATKGPFVRDIRSDRNWITLEAKIQNDTLYLGDINTFILSDKKVKNDGFEHRREFRFKDKYNQSGELILHEDPTAIDDDEKYLIFVLYEGKSEGRVFISREPVRGILNDNNELWTGHASGNINNYRNEARTNYSLKGRNLVGSLIQPSYATKSSGVVVVKIKVDGKGNVIEANAGATGSTTTDKTLWDASEKAAKATHFTPKGDNTPQWGTITYVFKISE